MDWFLECFRCGQRRRTGCSISRLDSKKNGSQMSVSTGLVRANDTNTGTSICDGTSNSAAKTSKTLELGKVPSVSRNDSARISYRCIKTEGRHHPTSEHSSNHLTGIETLEEEFKNSNEELVAEASQGSGLANEIRHLGQCSESLDSSDAFKRAFEAFENNSEKSDMEENRPLTYLQSVLSKVGTSDILIETFSDKTIDNSILKVLNKGSCNCSSSIETECHSISTHDAAQLTSDHLQMESAADFIGPKHKEEHSANISVCHPSFEEVTMDSNKPLSASVRKRRSSATYSFSGFIVIENEIEDRTAPEHAVSELCRSTEGSMTNIIETPDVKSDNLVETSKSLFAFATTSLRGDSISMEKPLSLSGLENFSFSSRKSEMEASSGRQDTGGTGTMYTARESPNSMQAENSWVFRGYTDSTVGQSQVETSEDSYDGFSDASSHKCMDSSFRTGYKPLSSREAGDLNCSEAAQLLVTSVKDEQSVIKRHANSSFSASQLEVIDKALPRNLNNADFSISAQVRAADIQESSSHSEEFNRMHADCLNDEFVSDLDSEGNIGIDSLFLKDQFRLQALVNDGQATSSDRYKLPDASISAVSNPELSEDIKFVKGIAPCMGSYTASCIAQAEPSEPVCDKTEIPMEEAFSTNCLITDSSKAWNAPSASVSDSESPLTPVSVRSHVFLGALSKDDQFRQRIDHLRTPLPSFSHPETPNALNPLTPLPSFSHAETPNALNPLRTPLPSLPHAETPNSIHSQSSPSSFGEDRPILGTVAAHWNHLSSSTKKWWDGKGIPNSTNKYKEDQKVSWHATPFEVRLERALAKQGRVFQKKLFIGAAEMEVSS